MERGKREEKRERYDHQWKQNEGKMKSWKERERAEVREIARCWKLGEGEGNMRRDGGRCLVSSIKGL